MSKTRFSTSLPASRTESGPVPVILALVSLPVVWLRRVRCRHELSMLSPEQMRDTGLNPQMVERESRKPFWRA